MSFLFLSFSFFSFLFISLFLTFSLPFPFLFPFPFFSLSLSFPFLSLFFPFSFPFLFPFFPLSFAFLPLRSAGDTQVSKRKAQSAQDGVGKKMTMTAADLSDLDRANARVFQLEEEVTALRRKTEVP